MIRALVIIALVIGALVGGLLALRNSARTGMPGDAVIERAKKREREQAQRDRDDADPP